MTDPLTIAITLTGYALCFAGLMLHSAGTNMSLGTRLSIALFWPAIVPAFVLIAVGVFLGGAITAVIHFCARGGRS